MGIRGSSAVRALCAGLALTGIMACGFGATYAQDSNAAAEGIKVESCASDPSVLGLERIVEIDPSEGPIFGGGRPGGSFLNNKEVVLTFDDGPLRPYTRPVLKALAAHCTKATFFMVGRMAAADPGLVKEVLAAGHTVGSHTWSHQNLKALQFFKSRKEFELGLAAVTKAAGRPVAPFFRFPYLSDNRMILNYVSKRQQATFFIDIDSKDFQTRDPNKVYDKILRDLAREGKGIILMHDIQPSTANMIKRLLDTLHAKGYKIVHMVPKTSAQALAEFENGAAKAIAAKSEKLREKPLADRSVVWTMAPPAGDRAAAKPAVRSESNPTAIQTGSTTAPAAIPAPAPAASGADSEVLPWSTAAPEPPKKAPPVKKQVRKQPEDLPWQMHVFQN